jgi:C4-dicarboxylate-specific signal transduction histidine kinase
LRELLINTSRTEPDGVLITVSDSGAGLPEVDPERIFEAFYTTKASSLGMGCRFAFPLSLRMVSDYGPRRRTPGVLPLV